jgi:hypothetical protein
VIIFVCVIQGVWNQGFVLCANMKNLNEYARLQGKLRLLKLMQQMGHPAEFSTDVTLAYHMIKIYNTLS